MVAVLEIQKPAMKWAGNKQGTPVIDRVAELYEPFRKSHVWHEPFVGIGGALLSINPDRAHLYDASAEVIGLHRWIQSGGKMLEFDCDWTEEDFEKRRSLFRVLQGDYINGMGYEEQCDDTQDEFFSLMLWLNRACFNGLWRVNRSGEFNVPVGRKGNKSLNRFGAANLPTYSDRWSFCEASFRQDLVEPDSFIYADPPYWGTHSGYVKTGFSWDDQVRLAEMLAVKENPVVLSNSSTPEIVSLYQNLGFALELIPVRRSISCTGNKRPPAVEVLAHKNCEGAIDG